MALVLLVYLSYRTVIRQHSWTTSTRLWDRAYADGSRKARLFVNLNSAYQQAGNFTKAKEWADQALARAPDLMPVKMNLAMHMASSGKLDEAIALLDAAMQRTPKIWQGWKILGKMCADKQDLDKAAACYMKALELRRGEDHDISNEVGVLHFRQGRLEEALTFFENAWKLNPLNGTYAYNIGILHLRANRPDQAREWALKIPPGAIVPGQLNELLANAETGSH